MALAGAAGVLAVFLDICVHSFFLASVIPGTTDVS
jgi:hypothetical protein